VRAEVPASKEVIAERRSKVMELWQDILKPVGYGVVGIVAGGLLLNYMVARARMVKAKEGK
jgi:uncharacterized protein (DUF2062 family)